MKMSPPVKLTTGVVKSGFSVVDGNFSIECFAKLDFDPGEAETFWLRWNLEAAAVPLYNVVVADRAFVKKAADAIQVPGSGTPGFFGLTRGAAEAPVVVGQEMAEDLVGRLEIGGTSQSQFTGETILERAPEAFDAALGLGRVPL
jgi:hypothetical protein